ncbi:MAG: hypothetical protein ACRC23_02075 [Aeromonas jandaei]
METKKYIDLKETKRTLRSMRTMDACKESPSIDFIFNEFESSLIEAVRAREAIENGDFRQSTTYYVRRAEVLAHQTAIVVIATYDDTIDEEEIKANLAKIIDKTLVGSIVCF